MTDEQGVGRKNQETGPFAYDFDSVPSDTKPFNLRFDVGWSFFQDMWDGERTFWDYTIPLGPAFDAACRKRGISTERQGRYIDELLSVVKGSEIILREVAKDGAISRRLKVRVKATTYKMFGVGHAHPVTGKPTDSEVLFGFEVIERLEDE